jgi:hypothetical protein
MSEMLTLPILMRRTGWEQRSGGWSSNRSSGPADVSEPESRARANLPVAQGADRGRAWASEDGLQRHRTFVRTLLSPGDGR